VINKLFKQYDYHCPMNLFADVGDNSVLDLIATLLLMAIWGCAIVAIDHLVWRNDWPKRLRVEVPKGLPGDG
jgi:hypothetical protein